MAAILFVLSALFCLFAATTFLRPKKRFPPGPPGLPVLGVAKEHPKTEFWKTYAAWGHAFGDLGIISFHVLGRRMVVVNSAAIADDLFNKRSAVYSNRPFPPMAGQLMRREKSMFYISDNDRFRKYRKLLHQTFNATASQNYWTTVEKEALVLAKSIVEKPEALFKHIRRNASATTMRIAFGYEVAPENDHFVALAEESMRVGSAAGAPGTWLVDSIPILKFVPDWFPGASFKRKAKAWSHQLYIQSLQPHNWVKAQMAAGTAVPSFTSRLMTMDDGSTPSTEYEDLVLWTAGALYAAGADTTVAGMGAFAFNMMASPGIQKKAQEEVDVFIRAEHRLPAARDRQGLPYVNQVLQETLRWGAPSPIGIFHASSRDDVYNGYFIGAKTTVIANIWAMCHDENEYANPMAFDPERFSKERNERDPRDLVFGFGRRVCPGQHVAEASLFCQMTAILATVDIRNPNKETPVAEFTTGIVSHVKPFEYTVVKRETDLDALTLVYQDLAQ